MAKNLANYHGIVLEVYLGKYCDVNRINRLSLNLFKHKLIDESKAFDYSVTKMFESTKAKFKDYINRSEKERGWKNVSFNLHDAYCCFLIFNGRKDDRYWFWKPKAVASITPYKINYTPYQQFKGDTYYRVVDTTKSRRGVAGKFIDLKHSKPGQKPVFERGRVIIRSTSKTNRIGQILYGKRERMNPVENGKTQTDALFNNYKASKEDGVTIVFANALYYSVYLEEKGRDVISNLVSTAEWLINTYGDKSKNTGYVIRKSRPNYKKTTGHIVNRNIVWFDQVFKR